MYGTNSYPNYVVYILNFLIAAFGVVLIVIGAIYTINEHKGVKAFLDISFGPLAISVGVLTFLVAIAGSGAAYSDNNCFLTIYASVLVAFFAIQLAFGVIAVDKNVRNEILTYVKRSMRDLFEKDDAASIRAFHDIESEFQCCGVNKYTDYVNAYPPSCCDGAVDPCVSPYTTGCAQAFTNAIKEYVLVIGAVAIAFAIVELIAAIFTFMRIRYRDDYNLGSLCCR